MILMLYATIDLTCV